MKFISLPCVGRVLADKENSEIPHALFITGNSDNM